VARSFSLNLNIPRVTTEVHDAAAAGLKEAAEHILGVSNSRVPIEEGTLERSGAVEVDDSALEAQIGYDTPYAVRQHEELTWRHDPGRQAKYLESAMADERETAQGLIAARIRRALRT
jgi:hypothetical protein